MSRAKDMEALRTAAELHLQHRCELAEVAAADSLKLLSELQVHQIELEMQNNELIETREKLESALARYTELYDFAPVGYFTLDRGGAIRQLNLAGARLLDKNRSVLIGRLFSSFVAGGYKIAFADVLHRAAAGEVQQSCEIALVQSSRIQRQLFVHIEIAPVIADAMMRAVVVDITDRIEAEQRLKGMSLRLLGAQEEARRQLASELHDRSSANLAALGINLDVTEIALKSRDWQEIGVRMSDNRALVQDTQSSIREICTELRPPALDYAGLAPAIEAYASQFSHRTGIGVDLDCKGAGMKLPDHIESTLFRIVQEALTNIAKHAQARNVQVQLCLESQPLCLNVVDDGRGFDPGKLRAAQGLGIINMREMAEFTGGSFNLDSKPGGGTRIHVELAPRTEEA